MYARGNYRSCLSRCALSHYWFSFLKPSWRQNHPLGPWLHFQPFKKVWYCQFFYIFVDESSHAASRDFVVWLAFYILPKLPDEQDLHVLIDFITANNLSIIFANLTNIWSHFNQFSETQVFNFWWIHLRSKFPPRSSTIRTLGMNICKKSRGPMLQR